MDLVSIIMPYYKKKEYVFEAINSVLKQTYRNFEIFLIYNDKEIHDLEYIKKISILDRRIKLIINKKRLSAGYARNLAIEQSKGKYIAFLDCDDVWKKNKLKKQVNFMKKIKAKISHTSYSIINHKNQLIGKRFAKVKINFSELLKSCDIGLSTVMIDKKILNKNLRFTNMKTKEDYVLWLNIAKNTTHIYGINTFLASWRKLDNSLSSSVIQKLIDGFRVYNTHMKYSYFKSIYCLMRLSSNYLLKRYE